MDEIILLSEEDYFEESNNYNKIIKSMRKIQFSSIENALDLAYKISSSPKKVLRIDFLMEGPEKQKNRKGILLGILDSNPLPDYKSKIKAKKRVFEFHYIPENKGLSEVFQGEIKHVWNKHFPLNIYNLAVRRWVGLENNVYKITSSGISQDNETLLKKLDGFYNFITTLSYFYK